MIDAQDNEKLARIQRYLQWAIILACIAVLGSCVSKINEVGGGHDAHQKMAGIFFLHLFFLVPCLFGLFVYLRVKLEKYFLSKETIDSLNKAHNDLYTVGSKEDVEALYKVFSALFKRKK